MMLKVNYPHCGEMHTVSWRGETYIDDRSGTCRRLRGGRKYAIGRARRTAAVTLP
jgi:hypothetical protein